MTDERGRLTRQGLLSPLAVAAFRRGELRFEAELRWHEEFERQLPAAGTGGTAPVRALHGAPGYRGRARTGTSGPDSVSESGGNRQ